MCARKEKLTVPEFILDPSVNSLKKKCISALSVQNENNEQSNGKRKSREEKNCLAWLTQQSLSGLKAANNKCLSPQR